VSEPPAEVPPVAARLARRENRSRPWRVLPTPTVPGGPVDFSSNDYLGLAAAPGTRRALADAAAEVGAGAGASPLVTGRAQVHATLEARIAGWLGTERALLFTSGYAANLGTLSVLVDVHDIVYADRLVHASLIDGVRLSGARLRRYPHLDYDRLARRLAERPAPGWIVSDGVFSMDGDVADIVRLLDLSDTHDAPLIVDDAHGFGVLGDRGLGVFEHAPGRAREAAAIVGTFGKAFGLGGAFVAGPAVVVDYLVNHARSYIYSTGLAPAIAGAVLNLWPLVMDDAEGRRARLADNVARFRRRAREAGLPTLSSTTPIQGFPVGDPVRAVALSEALEARGYLVRPMRAPTVPPGTERLRITLSARHRARDIDGLVDALVELSVEANAGVEAGP